MRTITEIMQQGDGARIHTLLTARKKPFAICGEELERQYNPTQHKIFDTNYRKRKKISIPTGKKDPITGQAIYKDKMVERVRIAIPVQKTIVERAVGFLFGTSVQYKMTQNGKDVKNINAQQQRLNDAVMKVFHANKMKYFDKKLARAVFRCREAAELWYLPTNRDGSIDKDGKVRVKLLSPIDGDKLYPHFDDYDRMDGFAREYKVYDEENNAINHFDVYDSRFVWRFSNEGSGWRLIEQPRKHGFTKIPIVYYRQELAEWEDVQPEIERAEDLLSNWGDTNDYFGTPKYFVKGKLEGFAEKGEQGSVFMGDKDTSMNVLSWDNSPNSVAGELGQLFSIIFSYTHSADISFERMKEVGNNTSGAALRLMLIDPHMNAQNKTELFGEMFTRRCNIVANAICETGIVESGIPSSTATDIDFEPIFSPYMPKNDVEELEMIQKATGGKATTSRKRGIELNPLNDDPERIEQEINEEEQAAMMQAAAAMGIGDTSNNAIESEE